MEPGSNRRLERSELAGRIVIGECLTGFCQVTDAVHDEKSFIFCQLWALGRAAEPETLREEDPSLAYVSASNIRMTGVNEDPRPLTVDEIKDYVQLYAQAATNAIKAGFDGAHYFLFDNQPRLSKFHQGVEIHGANGYLIDQFLQDVSNDRTDDYGGSIENRVRFPLEVTDAVVKAVGADRTGFRVSPWSPFQGDYRSSRSFVFDLIGHIVRYADERPHSDVLLPGD